MGKMSVFNFVSLSGYFEGPNRDISWAQHDAEGDDYSAEGLNSGSTPLFGLITYQLMASYWPTPLAMKNTPIVAAGMNNADKIVFSRSLQQADWKNTTLMKDNIVEEMKKVKQTSGKDMTLLGSGSILTQFAEQGLIDEYQILVNPVVLGEGTSIFKGIRRRLDLKLTSTRTFKNGKVLLCYQPAEKA